MLQAVGPLRVVVRLPAPFWIRLAMPAAREVTALVLPPALRAAYGIPLHPRRARVVAAILRVLVRVVPRRVREWPSRRLLAELKVRRADADTE